MYELSDHVNTSVFKHYCPSIGKTGFSSLLRRVDDFFPFFFILPTSIFSVFSSDTLLRPLRTHSPPLLSVPVAVPGVHEGGTGGPFLLFPVSRRAQCRSSPALRCHSHFPQTFPGFDKKEATFISCVIAKACCYPRVWRCRLCTEDLLLLLLSLGALIPCVQLCCVSAASEHMHRVHPPPLHLCFPGREAGRNSTPRASSAICLPERCYL